MDNSTARQDFLNRTGDADDLTLRILLLADRRPTHAGTVLDHIEALSGGSRHYVYCLNSRGWTATEVIDFADFDALVIHYSISIIHADYLPESFRDRIRAFRGLKAMFIQDEYRDVDAYANAMLDLGIDALFTCVPEKSVDAVYGRLRRAGVELFPTLTGFVPDHLARMPVRPLAGRAFDIVYRGRPVPFELGDLGREKAEIAIRINELALREGLVLDVDWREEARIYGGRWLDFMSSGRATLGTESGASIVDFGRSIASAVEAYRMAHPNASYREVADAVLRPFEGNVVINTISPRAFEAICLGTALILFPGEYSGILQPWRHYIPLAKDFSNFDEVVHLLRDTPYLERLTRTAREDIVDSGRYSFDAFSRTIDETLARLVAIRHPLLSMRPAPRLQFQDRDSWRRELDERVNRLANPQPVVIAGDAAAPVARPEPVPAVSSMAALVRTLLPARIYAAVRTALRHFVGR